MNGGAIVIWCDRACRGNGTSHAQASVGIYLGPDQTINSAEWVPADIRQTNQTAELHAMKRAIQLGTEMAIQCRRTSIIILSDSAYACNGITLWMEGWKETPTKIQNFDLFEKVDRSIDSAKKQGIQVKIWKIPREWNGAADLLANSLFDQEDEIYGIETWQVMAAKKGVPEDEDEWRSEAKKEVPEDEDDRRSADKKEVPGDEDNQDQRFDAVN